MKKYFVVTSTRDHPTKFVETGRAAAWVCAPLNLDVAVVRTVRS